MKLMKPGEKTVCTTIYRDMLIIAGDRGTLVKATLSTDGSGDLVFERIASDL